MTIEQEEFDLVRFEIQKLCGLHLQPDKLYLVKQRLEPLAQAMNVGGLSGLIAKMKNEKDPQLMDDVISAITTHETSFFRDEHPYQTFLEDVLPTLVALVKKRKTESTRKGSKISIWCAAASTGQEPYSLSMLIHDYLQSHPGTRVEADDFCILATDISSHVLAKAIDGRYSEFETSRGLAPHHLQKYYVHQGTHWVLKEEVKRIVHFRRVNLVEDFTHLGGFDLIFCRNVLIYFHDDDKRKILKGFNSLLSNEGFLFLGASENTYQLSDDFDTVRKNQTMYYKPKIGGGAKAG
ncbi:MAG: protein-glutamate O-methyltransferase CheR [Deltaproteobacteria bacterium]|nr:protein-glutamate O-methyltransferase CheR [Deltaproteobacteria bacterium]